MTALADHDARTSPGAADADALADAAVALVQRWLRGAAEHVTPDEEELAERLTSLVDDPDGIGFTMRFVDRVTRPASDAEQAAQLRALVTEEEGLPRFLGPVDKALLTTGGLVAPFLPRVVMPLARRRMRQIVGHLVVDAEPRPLQRHLAAQAEAGYDLNVNLLGEAVLGEEEARRRLQQTLDLVARDDVGYVSVKVSAVASQLDLWAFEHSLDRVCERLRPLYRAAAASSPPVFVNLDMEGYEDLALTVAAFQRLLVEPELLGLEAGLVLQAYLPDAAGVLDDLVAWADARRAAGGADVKLRLVKGANLAVEKVHAEAHGWPQAPYPTKHEVDASFKLCLDRLFHPERMRAVRLGVASHNLFDQAWAHLLAQARGVADRVDVEMLQGMAPALAREVREAAGGVRLYTPVVAPEDFDVAVSYLFRRLEESSAEENFLSVLHTLAPGTPAFVEQEERFRASLAARDEVATGPRRTQDRRRAPAPAPVPAPGTPFANEPDSDPALPATRAWYAAAVSAADPTLRTPPLADAAAADAVVARALQAQRAWAALPGTRRREVLHAAADRLAAARGDLVGVMASEAGKTPDQADPEVSELVDFARWYADRAPELDDVPGARLTALGVVLVTPPWNFPVAIPGGGCLAALAAGNAALLKPAPQTPRCAEVVVDAVRGALADADLPDGVADDLLRLVPADEGDVGRRLVTHPDVSAVVLTGAYATAQLFRSWRPDLHLLAETSGKNALVITPRADLDLAVADLVTSAFGHAGQKCSAASLGILVGDVARTPAFRRQLVDMVRSLRVGWPAQDPAAVVGPLVDEPGPDLLRALTTLDEGEEWLVEPRRLDGTGRLWSPGVKTGVRPGSWSTRTEWFGPVLALVEVPDLDAALAVQNSTGYGLTGGLHSLDPAEQRRWVEGVAVGNAYVNRGTTGAVVQRQPFGGWGRSSVGPGWKAGGPNHLLQLVAHAPDGLPPVSAAGDPAPSPRVQALLRAVAAVRGVDEADVATLQAAAADDARWWAREYGVATDRAGLVYEENLLRYLPRPGLRLRVADDGRDVDAARCLLAAAACAAEVEVSLAAPPSSLLLAALAGRAVRVEPEQAFLERLARGAPGRVRVVGTASAALHRVAADAEVDVAAAPVTPSGRLEPLWWLREQAVSRTRHRFGNLVAEAGAVRPVPGRPAPAAGRG